MSYLDYIQSTYSCWRIEYKWSTRECAHHYWLKMFHSAFHICPLWFYKFAHISIFTFSMIHRWFGRWMTASSLLLSYYTNVFYFFTFCTDSDESIIAGGNVEFTISISIINPFSHPWLAHFPNTHQGDFTENQCLFTNS